MLICLEASEADAERMGWTSEVRLFHGYDESDPRPPGMRALDLARQLSSEFDRVGIELSLGTQAADRMVGEPTTYPKAWFDAFPDASDATPLLAAARAIKTEQEIERMRLANDIAAGAMEHVKGRIRPGMRESEIAAMWNGWVHDHGTGYDGRVELAQRLLSRLVGPRDPHLHGHRQPSGPGARADAVRDLGLRRRLLVRPHEEPRSGRADGALRRARAAAPRRLRGRGRVLPPRCEPRRARPDRPGGARGAGLPRPAEPPDLPRRRRPRARAAVRAPGRRGYRRGRHGACDRARRLLAGRRRAARRGQLPDHGRRAGAALPLPGRDRQGMTIDREQGLDRRAERARARAADARHRRPLRHDAPRRRADGRSRALARGQARDRPRARRRRRRPDRGRLRARLGGGRRGDPADRRAPG